MLDHLKRGVAAGGLAGAAYGFLVWLALNPLIAAIEGLAHDHGSHAHAVSEATTAVVSAGGGVLWGIVLGAAFGVAYFLFEPALPGPGSRVKAAMLAAAGFFVVSGAPWLVLPPVAPGAEHALGPEVRLVIYAGMMVLGALAAAGAVAAYNRTAPVWGRGVRLAVAAIPLVALVGVAGLVPASGGGAPAHLVAAFRWLVVFGQIGLWGLIAVAFVGLDGVFGETEPTATVSPAD